MANAGPITVVRSGYAKRDRLWIFADIWGLAVALAMDAFLRLTSFAFGAVPLLMSLLATLATYYVVVLLYFHTSRIGISARVEHVISNYKPLDPLSIIELLFTRESGTSSAIMSDLILATSSTKRHAILRFPNV